MKAASFRRALPLLAVGALVLLLPLSQAQLQPVLGLQPDMTNVALGPGESATVKWTVSNTGRTDGVVTLTAKAPSGWNVKLDPPSISVPASQTRTATVTITPDSGTPSNGSLTLDGRIANSANQASTQSSSVQVNYVAPAQIPVPPPSRMPVIIGSSVGILVLLLGVYLLQASMVRLEVREPSNTITNGSHGTYFVRVSNKSFVVRTVQLRIKGLGRPWFAAFFVPTIKLGPHESADVPLSVRAPLDLAEQTKVNFKIQARPNGFSPWLVGRRLDATVAKAQPDGIAIVPAR